MYPFSTYFSRAIPPKQYILKFQAKNSRLEEICLRLCVKLMLHELRTERSIGDNITKIHYTFPNSYKIWKMLELRKKYFVSIIKSINSIFLEMKSQSRLPYWHALTWLHARLHTAQSQELGISNFARLISRAISSCPACNLMKHIVGH